MKSGTKTVLRVVISIVYIIWGIYSPIQAIRAVVDLNAAAIVAAAVGVLMLIAGIFGLFGLKKVKCRVFGIIIFVFAILSVVLSILAGHIDVNSIITAVLAWLFIVCL